MELFLNYVYPGSDSVVSRIRAYKYHAWGLWLNSMVESCPDVIFFFTVDSTDIF